MAAAAASGRRAAVRREAASAPIASEKAARGSIYEQACSVFELSANRRQKIFGSGQSSSMRDGNIDTDDRGHQE